MEIVSLLHFSAEKTIGRGEISRHENTTALKIEVFITRLSITCYCVEKGNSFRHLWQRSRLDNFKKAREKWHDLKTWAKTYSKDPGYYSKKKNQENPSQKSF